MGALPVVLLILFLFGPPLLDRWSAASRPGRAVARVVWTTFAVVVLSWAVVAVVIWFFTGPGPWWYVVLALPFEGLIVYCLVAGALRRARGAAAATGPSR